jgi:hypothetical protein
MWCKIHVAALPHVCKAQGFASSCNTQTEKHLRKNLNKCKYRTFSLQIDSVQYGTILVQNRRTTKLVKVTVSRMKIFEELIEIK